MSRSVIADKGFLVALLSRNDQYHAWNVVDGSPKKRLYSAPQHSE
ncbi:hypothetical protein Q2T42_15070 [Leptolyngbya boryana CZ1]|uniref:Uncharacterized protein n=1 Tax=Leptolyngbya boryana CZ1 TaxID=3060204 RepID=A0AA96X196_LEPBY|nr:hypothetical protein [Leptolyngbya boryana]WNZ49142.1 hypothetical protein Q2T42_15070 [Leptolyngbya boryana CZ1]